MIYRKDGVLATYAYIDYNDAKSTLKSLALLNVNCIFKYPSKGYSLMSIKDPISVQDTQEL